MKSKVGSALRLIAAAALLFMLAWSCCNRFTGGTAVGIVLFGGGAAACLAPRPLARLVKRLREKAAGKVLLSLGALLALLVISLCLFFSVNMFICMEKPLDDPQAVIVLGCQVKGEEPSLMMTKRLNAALETLERCPEAVCIVSGGKGGGEQITEAEAMRRYLTSHGVSESRIIIEDKSSSTRENLRFSSEIMKELGLDRAVIVTSEFHQYRASLYARRFGITAGHHSSRTKTLNVLNYFLREWGALFFALL